MHLVNTKTLELIEVTSEQDEPYAILSHRWQGDEVLFSDMNTLSVCSKAGIAKLRSFCDLPILSKVEHVWVDTCCIDKKSSAELSEAINSMFQYYRSAKICVAYLCDVHVTREHPDFEQQFEGSVWFTRCWTLQELIAPTNLIFFNSRWEKLASKIELVKLISKRTTVDEGALTGAALSMYSIAERMCWASARTATRREDIAYSLMGIFDVNMPMMYGEGHRAFERLQEEILRYSDDETLFAWSLPGPRTFKFRPSLTGLLADTPACFWDCQHLKPISMHERTDTFMMTNRGLTGTLQISPAAPLGGPNDTDVAFLNASFRRPGQTEQFVGIYLDQKGGRTARVIGINSRWEGTHLQVSKCRPKADKILVRQRHFRSETQPNFAYFFDLSPVMQQPRHVSKMLFRTVSIPQSDISLAAGAGWGAHNDVYCMQREDTTVGPMCTLKLGGHLDVGLIQLGINRSGEPICLVLYADDAAQDYWKWKERISTGFRDFDHGQLCYAADHDQAPWTEVVRDKTQYIGENRKTYMVKPNQPYTSMLAFKGRNTHSTSWICLQRDRQSKQFKQRTSFQITLTLRSNDPWQRLWVLGIESVNTKV